MRSGDNAPSRRRGDLGPLVGAQFLGRYIEDGYVIADGNANVDLIGALHNANAPQGAERPELFVLGAGDIGSDGVIEADGAQQGSGSLIASLAQIKVGIARRGSLGPANEALGVGQRQLVANH